MITQNTLGPSVTKTITMWYFCIKFSANKRAAFKWILDLRFVTMSPVVNTLRPRQNGRHFADDTFKRIFLNENVIISIQISLKFVPKGPINNIPALVLIMAWHRLGDKPLSEAMMVSLLTHICVTRPQWVKTPPVWVLCVSCVRQKLADMT